MTKKTHYELFPNQYKFAFEIDNEARIKSDQENGRGSFMDFALYKGGFGSGKTFVGSLRGLLFAFQWAGCSGLVGAASQDLLDNTTFNFCLKNEQDEWDNNNGENYVFKIERPETSLILLNDLEKPARRLKKSYILTKKIKLAIYKMLIYFPRLISGNYKKKNKRPL